MSDPSMFQAAAILLAAFGWLVITSWTKRVREQDEEQAADARQEPQPHPWTPLDGNPQALLPRERAMAQPTGEADSERELAGRS
jgi:hypothetical protein